MTELEAYKLLVNSCFLHQLNLNDTFYYSCADCEDIDSYDVEKLIPLIQRYGHEALVAYAAVKRRHDPKISQVVTEIFKTAKKEIETLANTGEIQFEEHWKQEEFKKDEKDFDGQKITWSSRMLPVKDGWIRVLRIAKLKDGLLAVGGSEYETRARLLAKYRRRKERLLQNQSGAV